MGKILMLEENTMNEMKKFYTINEASETTGLSRCFLRAGCQSGEIPHIRAGVKFLINVPALLEQLDLQSREGAK